MKNTRKTGSNAARNTPKKQGGKGRPFQKNDPETGEKDPRINRNGAPRRFDELRALTLELLAENLELKKGDVVIRTMTQAESILRDWILSRDAFKQNRVLEIGYGKVPDELHHSYDEDEFIRKHIDKFTDGELQRIQQGENGLDILLSKLESQFKEKKK